jgi:hypothetical protein
LTMLTTKPAFEIAQQKITQLAVKMDGGI